jgi:hypothetical protein
MLRTLDSEVHPPGVHGFKHFFGRSVIAHNSGFDRKFAERYWSVFERKAWACSATEIEWRKHGFAGA